MTPEQEANQLILLVTLISAFFVSFYLFREEKSIGIKIAGFILASAVIGKFVVILYFAYPIILFLYIMEKLFPSKN